MAGKIFVTGDTHRDFKKLNTTRFPQQKNLDKGDFVIICGDFGGIWDYQEESKNETWWLNWLDELPFTVLFVDGNHENYDRLEQYPVEEWNGGKVQKIRPSVIRLMRGQVYEIAGKKIFTFGGARSHDISDGILELNDPKLNEKVKELRERRGLFRINHLSWWKEEMPSENEMEEGWINLKKHGNEVDYIITHCGPGQVQTLIDERLYEQDELTAYFDSIRLACKYKKWYFGHYHEDKTLSPKEVVLYSCIIELGEGIDELQPILGKPRYELYQPVKFFTSAEGERMEKIGVVVIRDPYGNFSCPNEPSYDIYAKLEGNLRSVYSDEECLFKHISESEIRALTESELTENAELISHLARDWGKKG